MAPIEDVKAATYCFLHMKSVPIELITAKAVSIAGENGKHTQQSHDLRGGMFMYLKENGIALMFGETKL